MHGESDVKVGVLDDVWLSSTSPLHMLAVLELCDTRRHLLLLSPKGRKHALDWVDAHARDGSALKVQLMHVLEANRRAGTNASTDGAMITVVADGTDWNMARLVPPLASRLLRRPLKLLVENSRNDRAFLLKLAEPRARRELDMAIKAGWIEFEMGGGIHEIHQRLLGFTGKAHQIADHLRIELARLWVMFDRDADLNDRSKESDRSRQVRECAAQLTIPWPLAAHQLERRTIENYVPAETIRGWWCGQARTSADRIEREQLAKGFLDSGGLATTARRFYNMKRGLRGDVPDRRKKEDRHTTRPPLVDGDLDPLFRGLQPATRDCLAQRGFRGLADAFGEVGAVSDRALAQEVALGERRRLVASILERM